MSSGDGDNNKNEHDYDVDDYGEGARAERWTKRNHQTLVLK